MSAPAVDRSAAVAAQAQSESLREAVVAFLRELWAALGEYRNQQISTFLGEFLPYLKQAQQEMADLTVQHLELQGARAVPVNAEAVSGANVRNGTEPAEVYERPFHLVWRQLHDLPREDGAIEAAIEAGRKRAELSALTDLQLTKTHTAQTVLAADPQVVGYRRVLEGDASCGLCIVASTQRYTREDLMPIHPACDCSVAPIIGDADPGLLVNAPLLEAVHDAIDETFGSSSSSARSIGRGVVNDRGEPLQYRDVLITHRHGELGPVLAVKGRPFLSLHN